VGCGTTPGGLGTVTASLFDSSGRAWACRKLVETVRVAAKGSGEDSNYQKERLSSFFLQGLPPTGDMSTLFLLMSLPASLFHDSVV
jgi:hypothetical protein